MGIEVLNEVSDDDISDDDDVLPIYAGDHDSLSDALSVGDNFAVNAEEGNDEDAYFYIIKCYSQKEKTTKAQKDAWGNCISARSYVVQGHFYAKVQNHDDLYHLLDNRPPILIYSHLVRALKFKIEPVQGEGNVFRLPDDVLENMYNSMPLDL